MLSRWKPINSLLTSKNKETSDTPPKAVRETSEHREHRLRQQYEESLMLHRQNQTIPAKRAFEQISQDLYQTETNRWSITQEHIKRHKKDDTPLWERRLRYAVNRNLAEVYEKLEDYPHAVTAYSNALSDDPSDFLIWIRAGRSAAFSGHLHIARKALEIAKTFRPNHWLHERVYKDVLDVIGDADEDVKNSTIIPNHLSQGVMHIVKCRQNALEKEIEKFNADPLRQPQLIQLDQLSWDALVTALLICFKQRITGTSEAGFYNVGHAIAFELPQSYLDSAINSPLSDSSDEIQFVSEIHCKNAEQLGQTEDVIVIHDDEKSPPKNTNQSDIQPTERDGANTNSVTNVKQPMNLVDAEERSIPTEEKGQDEKALSSHHTSADEDMQPKDNPPRSNPVNHSDDDKIHPEMPEPVDKKPVINSHGTEKLSAGGRKQDLRRSSRQRAQNEQSQIEKDKRQTRNATELRDIFQLDSDLIQALVDISLDESYVTSHVDSPTNDENQKETIQKDDDDINLPFANRKECAWTKVVNNLEEARDVKNYIDAFKDSNSGPADLLLRILQHLSDSNTSQFSSTLATLWSSVKDNLQLHLPGSPSSTVLIAEAMLSSGKKVGKAKAKRFQEAARLLSHVKFYNMDAVSTRFLKIRLAWVWSQLHECRGEMQHSFESAELALKLANDEKDDSVQMVPDIAGPDLSGYSVADVRIIIAYRLSRLKTARDLEKAEEELQRVRTGDVDAANRIIAILGDSVRSSVREIGLHKWDPDDLKTDFDTIEELEKWENRFDAEVEFEPRLLIFEEACIKSDDLIGSLACFSFRLRMTVHYYTAQLKCEQEKEYQPGPDEDSSGKRLTDLLVQVRKFVFVIKKISSSTDKSLWNKKRGANKWTMSEAASAAIVTLISLTQLLITKVPAVKGPAPSTELPTGSKNLRLGFTRCMLAFPRCIMIRQKCDIAAWNNEVDHEESEDGLTVKLLYITSFCLKALASRGCCRSEGTSGALIKLYISLLLKRLQNLAMCDDRISKIDKKNASSPNAEKEEESMAEDEEEADSEIEKSLENSDDDKFSVASTDSGVIKVQPEYPWSSVDAIRHELSQCLDCLYQIQEFESASDETKSLKRGKWLKKGCEISRKMGLAFTNGDPNSTVANLDVDVCTNVYLFYRKKIFEAVYLPRRDGGRIKRVLEILSRLVENLSLDPPEKVHCLRRDSLDDLLNDVTLAKSENPDETSRRVKQLADNWSELDPLKKQDELNTNSRVLSLQYSILYFELLILHTYSLLSAHDSEYKKQKSAERRKRPKEVAERLLTASFECMAALRVRPWSVGAWILLGRVFSEIVDLALDERELVLSSFGLYRPDEVIMLDDKVTIATYFNRAEACFALAQALLDNPWPNEAMKTTLGMDAAKVLGYSYDETARDSWCGFGDDGDLFGSFGLTNLSTSRPCLQGESHPIMKTVLEERRRKAAIHFGWTAIYWLRLQEERYFLTHWNYSSLETKKVLNTLSRYPDRIEKLLTKTLENLREGRSAYAWKTELKSNKSTVTNIVSTEGMEEPKRFAYEKPKWRSDFVSIDELDWYYTMLEAKLVRKLGKPPSEYLSIFKQAVDANQSLRKELKQNPDIEPIYKLHAARMRILCSSHDNKNINNVLTLLESYSFGETRSINLEGPSSEKDSEDWIAERRIGIAEDILSAMQYCSDPKTASYCEFYYKAIYCKGIILAEVLKDVRGALEELGKIFRIDAAARVMDQGPDGAHRGYFYKFWSYRITETGTEPALETDRKLIRWRSKLLGLYAQLLKQTGEWRLLAAIILRLKKRMSEDLPIDGALLDDLIEAFALTSREAILQSMEKSIVTDASAFESSFRRTWDIYVDTLRLAQALRRVRVGLSRDEKNETGGEILVQSNRPRCLVAAHTVLRLEHIRWRSAVNGEQIDISAMKDLPISGSVMQLPSQLRFAYVETLTVCQGKWKPEDKIGKILVKRMEAYSSQSHQ